MLLQTPGIGSEFGLPATAVANRIYCETTDAVDDVRIEFTDGVVFGQCKRSLRGLKKPSSQFASAFRQFLTELGKDSFVRTRHRFVLFYEEHNSSLERLGSMLDRYRAFPEGTFFRDADWNRTQQHAVDDLDHLLDELLSTSEFAGMAPLKELLLTLTYIRRVSFAPGDSDRHMIEIAVANTLLEHRDQARNVMDSLQVLSNDRMERRAAIVRSDIRSHLQNRGFVLLDSPDFRNDFKKLDNWTRDQISLDASAGQDILRIGSHRIQIARPVQRTTISSILRRIVSRYRRSWSWKNRSFAQVDKRFAIRRKPGLVLES